MTRFFLAVALIAATFVLVHFAHRESPPVSRVARARALIDRILTEAPRPTGSSTNAAMLDHIERELRSYGYAPERQKAFICAENGACAEIENLLARTASTSTNSAILLAAHHDTVPASPGASDDGAGVVAMLEIARELADQRLKRDVIYLFTDGEEIALLGARAFAQQHRWSPHVAAALIVEGMGGPTMIEVLSGHRSLASVAMGRGAGPMIGSSAMPWISTEVVTDANVFDHRGVPSAIFGGYGEFDRYHSPNDRPGVLDAHAAAARADLVLAAVKQLATAELADAQNAVFFDLAGRWWISFPARTAIPLALLALVLVIVAIAGAGGREALLGAMGAAVRALFFALSIGAFVGGVLLMRATWILPGRWAEPQELLRALALVLPLAICLLSDKPFFPRQQRWGGIWLGMAWLGVVLALSAPEISYFVVVPSICAGLIGLRGPNVGASIVPAMVLALLIAGTYPLAPLMLTVRSFAACGMIHLPLVLALWPLFPDEAKTTRNLGVFAALIAAGLIGAVLLAPPSIGHAQLRLDTDADTLESRWLILGRAKDPLGEDVKLGVDPRPYPWWSNAPVLTLRSDRSVEGRAPELSDIQRENVTGGRRIRARLRSQRGAEELSLALSPEAKVKRIEVEGRLATPSPYAAARAGGWWVITIHAPGKGGVELTLELGSEAEAEAVLFDFDRGLPPNELEPKRPPHVVTAHGGDGTMLRRRLKL